jgi:hypothetical protein
MRTAPLCGMIGADRQDGSSEMNGHDEQKNILLNAVMALAIGALLGTLSVVPYDQVLGLSGVTGTVLQSAISVALLGALNLGRVTDLTYESNRTPERAPGSFFADRPSRQTSGTQIAFPAS